MTRYGANLMRRLKLVMSPCGLPSLPFPHTTANRTTANRIRVTADTQQSFIFKFPYHILRRSPPLNPTQHVNSTAPTTFNRSNRQLTCRELQKSKVLLLQITAHRLKAPICAKRGSRQVEQLHLDRHVSFWMGMSGFGWACQGYNGCVQV